MSHPPRPGLFVTLVAGCLVRSCLLVGLVMLLAPLLLFLGGGAAGMYLSIRNAPAAEAFRTEPPCPATGGLGSRPCYVVSIGAVDSVNAQIGRGPTQRVDVILRLSDGEHPTRLDLWFWNVGAIRPGQPVRARLDQGKVTEIFIGDNTFETIDSPEYASTTPRQVAIFFWAVAVLIAGVMAFAGRGSWAGLIRESWGMLRPTPSRSPAGTPTSSAINVSPSVPALGDLDKQALLKYSTAPPFDANDPSRQVIPLSRSQQVLSCASGLAMIAAALFGVFYVQTILVEFMAACLALFGLVLVWWAMTWKLILTPTGFEVVGMLTRKRRRWEDVSAFGVDLAPMGRGVNYQVSFEDSTSYMVGSIAAKGKWRAAFGSLGNHFAPRGMSAQDQAKLLEEWRARYSR